MVAILQSYMLKFVYVLMGHMAYCMNKLFTITCKMSLDNGQRKPGSTYAYARSNQTSAVLLLKLFLP